MNSLTILYDDHCGICSQLRKWLGTQATYLPLRFMPLHTGLETQFPGVMAFRPEEKLVVIADDGALWQGDGAWITLLWALVSGRELSLKLSNPALRPLARKVVTAVSANRIKLSRWLKLTPEVLAEADRCSNGVCRV